MLRRLVALPCFVALCLAGPASQAVAQTYPSKPIRVIIPFGPGSATDVLPRIVLEKVSAQIGQPIIVENRPGAGGMTGTAAVAHSEPDGHTLLATSSAYTIVPSVYSKMPYDPMKAFSAISPFGSLPNVLIVAPSKGHKTVQDMVAAAKAKPGTFNFASVGVGSATHLAAERFRLSAGFEAVHVPFRGGPEALSEVIAGRVDFYMCPINTALPFIRDGKLAALALGNAKRSQALPDVPTTLEAGYANSDLPVWIGLLAPANTPRDIVERLNREISKALDDPSVKQRLGALGVETMAISPAEFDARIAREIETAGALAKAAGIKAN